MTRTILLPAALVALLLAFAAPASAAEQITSDPDDAYTLAPSQSDVRVVEFVTEGADVTVTVRMENSTQFAAFSWFDVDRDARADYSLVMDGGSGSATFDAELYAVPASTTACQLYNPATAPLHDVQPKVTLDPDGFAVLKLTFPASLLGGATAWTWASFGYTFNGLNAPGWDYVPDETNPDAKVGQPASRDCSIDQVAGAGVALNLANGIEFPTPPPSNGAPVARFGWTPTAPLSTDPITFTSTSEDFDGTIVSQRWDLDSDGLYDDASGSTATTSFARKGPHTVRLIVEDDAGAVSAVSHVVDVGNRPPVANFVQVTDPGLVGEPIRIESTSTDDGQIVSYEWDTDRDGQFDDETGPIIFPTFATADDRAIFLRVTDDDGLRHETWRIVFIDSRPPIARLVVVPANPVAGQAVTLDASTSTDPEGDSLRYAFATGFRDFTHSRLSDSPRHSIPVVYPGVNSFHVRVVDSTGASAIATQEIDIPVPPTRFFLFGPDPERVILSDTVELYGRWEAYEGAPGLAGSGPARLCVALGSHEVPPADCAQPTGLDRDGSWTRSVSGLVPGFNRITAFLVDARGQIRRIETTIERVSTTSGLDLRAASIEVTQGSQFLTLPNPRDRTPGAERVADYNGVLLARGGTTYARVFANARSLARGNVYPSNVTVTLTGYRGSTPLPGGPLTPITGPSALVPGPTIQADPGQRASPSGAYLFQLPDEWSGIAGLRLDATVDPAGQYPECDTCRRDNTFSLRSIGFQPAPRSLIAPVRMTWVRATGGPVMGPPEVEVVFDALQRLSPGGALATTVLPYSGQPLNISDIANSTMSEDDKNWRVFDRAVRWSDGSHTAGAHPVGVNTGVARGLAAPALLINPLRTLLVMVAESNRPLTSVSHELFHAYGAGHASSCTNGGDPGTLGFGIDGWPPDQRGQLNGYALDLRPGSGGRQGPFRILPPTNYDFMSYCANPSGDMDSWLSARNWNRRMSGPLDQPYRTSSGASRSRVARAAQAGASLLVTGAIDTKGKATILRVEPTSATATAPAKLPTFAVIVRGAGGGVLSSTPVAPDVVHAHENPGEGGRYFRVVVPGAASAASVDIAGGGGAVLTSRTASATAPTISLRRPKFSQGDLRVSWQAADADKDALVVNVELAPDGQRFRTVALDLQKSNSADIPLDGLPAGRRARVRVTVSDGFRAASATSAPFVLATGGSDVRILDPTPKTVLLNDQGIALRGEAITPTGKRVSVTWFAGARKLGRGQSLNVRGLPAGKVKLRLVATDGGVAVRTVKVRSVKPVFTVLRAPRRLSRSARFATLRVSTNLPATLTIGGRRYALDRKVRAVKVKVGNAKALRGRLTAGGKTTRITLSLR